MALLDHQLKSSIIKIDRCVMLVCLRICLPTKYKSV